MKNNSKFFQKILFFKHTSDFMKKIFCGENKKKLILVLSINGICFLANISISCTCNYLGNRNSSLQRESKEDMKNITTFSINKDYAFIASDKANLCDYCKCMTKKFGQFIVAVVNFCKNTGSEFVMSCTYN